MIADGLCQERQSHKVAQMFGYIKHDPHFTHQLSKRIFEIQKTNNLRFTLVTCPYCQMDVMAMNDDNYITTLILEYQI